MRCLVINLDRSTGRLAWVQSQFAAAGLTFERFSAVDMNDITPEAMARITRPRKEDTLWARSEVACFLSHRECWQRIAAGPDAFVAVFEDDIFLSRNAAEFLDDTLWMPPGVELVKIETFLQRTTIDGDGTDIKGHRLSRLHQRHWGSAGYIISRGLAAHLFATSETFDRTVDEFLFDPPEPGRDHPSWQLVPALCVQDTILNDEKAAIASILDPDRIATRLNPSIGERILEEVTWPYRRLKRAANDLYRQFMLKQKVGKIPFAADIFGQTR